jgi:hypothetical protein
VELASRYSIKRNNNRSRKTLDETLEEEYIENNRTTHNDIE